MKNQKCKCNESNHLSEVYLVLFTHPVIHTHIRKYRLKFEGIESMALDKLDFIAVAKETKIEPKILFGKQKIFTGIKCYLLISK